MAKSFFEKLGLVEAVYDDSATGGEGAYDTVEDVDVPDLESGDSGVSPDELVDSIYKSNGLDDKSRSVYKVGELIDTLPKDMPDKTLITVVSGLMKTMGLSASDVRDDANHRKSVLEEVKNISLESYANDIQKLTEKIQECKGIIEDCTKEIDGLNKDGKLLEEVVKSECSTIDKLLGYVAEEGEKSATV